MDIHEPGSQGNEEGADLDHSASSGSMGVFETDAWIPMWEQSIPGERIALGSVPMRCNLYLEPEPHFAIEVNLEGVEALENHRIITQQGEHVPLQFEGLQYGNYLIRGNNYFTWNIANDNMQLHANYRLLDKGLRVLRLADDPIAEVRGFVINFAIENHRTLTLMLNDWIVTLSPQQGRDDDDSNYRVTHEIRITNDKGHFSDAELDEVRDRLRIVLSVINVQCCEIALTRTFDAQACRTTFMIDQLHCDPFNADVLHYRIGSSKREEEIEDTASKLYQHVQAASPQYLEALELLTCSYHQSIPSLWTILEKTCGSGPTNVRGALQRCVESTRIPSEFGFLAKELKVGRNADFVDVFYGMRNHFAHAKNKIARDRVIPPEIHTIVKRLAQLLCWSKVLTDVDVKCLLWQEARVSFADWGFAHNEGRPTTLNRFQSDGTYSALAAIRRLLRGGETPGQTSAYFETPEGRVLICEATDWPKEMPRK